MKVLKQFIDGEWILSTTNEIREIINNFYQEIIAEVTEGNNEDAKKSIQGARKEFDKREWETTHATDSGQIVRKIATLIERDKEELARLESLNNGKTVSESRDDMDGIADVFHYYADLAGKDAGEMIDSPIPNTISKVVREPVGVCGQITPWNYPLLQ